MVAHRNGALGAATLAHASSSHTWLKHWLPALHTAPLLDWHVPCPLHVPAQVGVEFASLWPSGTGEQAPAEPATLHAMHVPVHAVAQQTPSTQKPDEHSALLPQAKPDSTIMHAAAPLQLPVPPHSLSGSFPDMIMPHCPLAPPPFFAAEHERHVSVQALPQQKPSAQYPDKHVALVSQATPLKRLHVPAPPHEPLAHSLSGSLSVAMGPHVPSVPWLFFVAVQASQSPVHAVSQHTPSAQLPDVH